MTIMLSRENVKQLQAHHLAEQYPLIEGNDFEQLKADIKANGLREPIMVYQEKILDGRNRYRVCTELGIDVVYKIFQGDDAAASAYVDSMNLHRRHLTPEWRKKRVAVLREQGLSTRAIAEKVGVDQSTVVRDLKSGDANASPEPKPAKNSDACEIASNRLNAALEAMNSPAPKVTGRDGKTYAAKKPEAKKAAAPKPEPETPPPAEAEDDGDAFVKEVETICRDIDQIVKRIKALKKSNLSYPIHIDSAVSQVEAARKGLWRGRPLKKCTYCKGKGGDCKPCHGTGRMKATDHKSGLKAVGGDE